MKVSQPLVSVIIPSYNHEKYVEQAIMSVVNQTYKNIELIIIDDGSKDNSPYLIKELINSIDSYKIIFEIQENMGLTKTLNKAINMANGEFIAFLASDDMYLPNRVEEGVNVFLSSKADVGVVYSDGVVIDEDGNQLYKYSEKYKVPLSKNTYKELLLRDWIPAPGVLYRKSSLIECGLFDESSKLEDYDILLRLSQKYKFEHISKPLFFYRVHGLNFSSDAIMMDEYLKLLSRKFNNISSFYKYRVALRNKNFIEFFHECSLLNLELTFRYIIFKIQRRFS
jgi:glycosyltransferase involved in cell wall biosynthesis